MDPSTQAQLIVQTFQKHLDFFVSTELLLFSAVGAIVAWLSAERRVPRNSKKWRFPVLLTCGFVLPMGALGAGLYFAWDAHQDLLVQTAGAYKGSYDPIVNYISEKTNWLFLFELIAILAAVVLTMIGWGVVHHMTEPKQ